MNYYRITRTKVVTEISELIVLRPTLDEALASAKRVPNDANWDLVSAVFESEYVVEHE